MTLGELVNEYLELITFQITGVPNSFQGNWQITDGTGPYTHLRGTGTWTEADDPLNGDHVFTCTGSVRFDP